MTKSTRRVVAGVGTIGLVLLVCAGDSLGQDKKVHDKHDQAALNQSLRDVINSGARLFNDQGDHAGCFHLYKGALTAVRPFLAADLQKSIDEAFGKSDGLASYADRAFALRSVLDDIRAKTKPSEAVVGPKLDGPKVEKGQVAGKITYQGKAQPSGYFVTLVSGDGKKYSSALQKDGSFSFKTPIPVGEYRVAVEPIPGEKIGGTPLPARYESEATSGLSIRVQAGKQLVDLNLVN